MRAPESPFICVRQRAGPLIKELVTDRRGYLQRYGVNAVRNRCGPAMSRSSVDKLELRLALFGYSGIFYTLTFADEYLPDSRSGVMRIWEAFCKRLKRWNKGKSLDYYVYRIEGLHGDHRYHIHAFLRDEDFPPAVVRYLWDWGEAYDVPYNYKKIRAENGYRKLAVYFTKELPEVGTHPWGCSRKLSKLLPLPEVRPSATGHPRGPKGAILLPAKPREGPSMGDWGLFYYAKYLLPEK